MSIISLTVLYETVNLLGLRNGMILTRFVSWSETPKHAESTPLLFAFLYHYEMLLLSFQFLPVANFESVDFFSKSFMQTNICCEKGTCLIDCLQHNFDTSFCRPTGALQTYLNDYPQNYSIGQSSADCL